MNAAMVIVSKPKGPSLGNSRMKPETLPADQSPEEVSRGESLAITTKTTLVVEAIVYAYSYTPLTVTNDHNAY